MRGTLLYEEEHPKLVAATYMTLLLLGAIGLVLIL